MLPSISSFSFKIFVGDNSFRDRASFIVMSGRGWARGGGRWVLVVVAAGVGVAVWREIGIMGSFLQQEGGGVLDRGRFVGDLWMASSLLGR